MKKTGLFLLAFVLVFTLFTGCGTQSDAANNNTPNDANGESTKLSVYASFYPLYDLALKVGGDKIELVNLVPAGTEPHDWEPSAADITSLEKADVLIYNGVGMEHWVDKVLSSLQNKKLIAVEASQGVTLLAGHLDEEEGEGAKAENEAPEEGEHDPHVWLSPKNAKIEMENIKNAFVQADPANKDYYQANYEQYASEFDKLDKEFSDTLRPLANKNVIVAHQAFGYLCAEYGLNQVPIEGLSADSEPDPARMAEIIEFSKNNNVKVIFFEELVSPKVAETVADAIGAKTEVLNPLEGLSDEDLAAGKDYFTVMRKNLESLKEALQYIA